MEDDLVHRAGVYPETAYRDLPEAREWLKIYTEMRFGRTEPTADELRYMRREAAHVVSRASPSFNRAG